MSREMSLISARVTAAAMNALVKHYDRCPSDRPTAARGVPSSRPSNRLTQALMSRAFATWDRVERSAPSIEITPPEPVDNVPEPVDNVPATAEFPVVDDDDDVV